MIKSIGVKNFKSIGNTNIEIKPLTILLGGNCSGKSSLLQTLLLMKQTVTSGESRAPLVLRENMTDLGAYQDIVKDHNLDKTIELNVKIEAEMNLRSASSSFYARAFLPEIYTDSAGIFSLRVRFRFSREEKKIYIEELEYRNEDKNEWLVRAYNAGDISEPDKYEVEVPIQNYYSYREKKRR